MEQASALGALAQFLPGHLPLVAVQPGTSLLPSKLIFSVKWACSSQGSLISSGFMHYFLVVELLNAS